MRWHMPQTKGLHMSDTNERTGDLFVAYLRDKLPLVEQALREASASAMSTDELAPVSDLSRYLYQPLAHFTAGGGKRVRPVLALMGAEAVGGNAEQALSSGVAIELFQSAALIHDDIADASELRRGEPCLYRTEGEGLAINAGDLALTRVFEVVLEDPNLDAGRRVRVLEELVRMERHTLEGQALDLGWARDGRWDVTSDDYLYMIEGKTAWYTVASPLFIGAVAAGASDEAARGLIDLGRRRGSPSSSKMTCSTLLATPAPKARTSVLTSPRANERLPWYGRWSTSSPSCARSSSRCSKQKRMIPRTSRAPSSSSRSAGASTRVVISHSSSRKRRKTPAVRSPRTASFRTTPLTCSAPWPISSSIGAHSRATRA